ncbi:hypothetical protein C8J57DRAFT_758708 [Mycena rebaudengoi]|nr:hypothetical protein C8J57DRAFT_758708 [Mycena rebaudengoi]
MRESTRIHAVRLTILLESTAALSSSSSIATDALHSQIHTQISQADLTALRTADASARRAPLLKLPHPIKDANVPFQIEHLRAGSAVLSSSPAHFALISSESRPSPTSHVRRPTLSSIGVLRGVLVPKAPLVHPRHLLLHGKRVSRISPHLHGAQTPLSPHLRAHRHHPPLRIQPPSPPAPSSYPNLALFARSLARGSERRLGCPQRGLFFCGGGAVYG